MQHLGKSSEHPALSISIMCQTNLTKTPHWVENRDTYLTFMLMAGDENRLSENSDLDIVHAEIAQAQDESTLKKWVRNGINTVAAVGLVAAGTLGQAPEAKAEEAKKPVELAQILVLPGLAPIDTAKVLADGKARDQAKLDAATKKSEAAARLLEEIKKAVTN